MDRNDTQNSTVLELKISLVNCETLKQKSTVDLDSLMALIIGDNLNNILVYEKYRYVCCCGYSVEYYMKLSEISSHSYMMTNSIEKSFSVQRQQQSEVTVNFISMDWGESGFMLTLWISFSGCLDNFYNHNCNLPFKFSFFLTMVFLNVFLLPFRSHNVCVTLLKNFNLKQNAMQSLFSCQFLNNG